MYLWPMSEPPESEHGEADCGSATAPVYKVKEEPPTVECPARSIDLLKLPATRKQRRQTLVFDLPLRNVPQVNVPTLRLQQAPSLVRTPVGILISGGNSSCVHIGNVHFTPPAVHRASAVPIPSGPDDMFSPGIDSEILSVLLRFVFAILVRVVVILFYGTTLCLSTLVILVLAIRMV